MTLITIREYQNCLENFHMVDCAVRNRDIFYFVAREDYHSSSSSEVELEESLPPDENELKKNIVIFIRTAASEKNLSRATLLGFDRTQIGYSSYPTPKAVAISQAGLVYAIGSGAKGVETPLPSWEKGGPSRGGIHRVKTIGGNLYFCGGNNSVGKRIGKDSWLNHTCDIPNPARGDSLDSSLDDIDGFDETDIYAAGRDGQVFHFDGMIWSQIRMPTTEHFETLCCAGDGMVYIGGVEGSIYVGRYNKWKKIHSQPMSLPFQDMVWYVDRVWCTSDYGLWTICNEKLERVELPEGMHGYAGNLSVGDGVLLLAGYAGAAFLENNRWKKIFSATEMRREMLL